MASHKRMHSDSLYDSAKPTKSSKVHDSPPPSDALEIANARIGDLEQQIQDLHKFINAKGLTRSQLSGSILERERRRRLTLL